MPGTTLSLAAENEFSTLKRLHNRQMAGAPLPVPVPHKPQKFKLHPLGATGGGIWPDAAVAGDDAPQNPDHRQPGRNVQIDQRIGRLQARRDRVEVIAVDHPAGQCG